VFVGESKHTLDAKRRIAVPRRFQSELGRGVDDERAAIVTRGFEGCLFLFSEDGFEQVLQRLKTRAFGGPEERKMQRLFFANTHRCPLDKAGRLLLPEKLCEVAQLEREIVLVGVAERAEIWSERVWEQYQNQHGADFDRLDNVLCGDGEAPPGEE